MMRMEDTAPTIEEVMAACASAAPVAEDLGLGEAS